MEKIVVKNTDETTSEIIIEKGLMNNLENYLNEDKKYFLVTNTTLYKLYPNIIKKFDKNRIIVIKDGEKYKNQKTYNYIIERLLKEKIERKDVIVSLSGGVVGDLAGFVASSILRGVELIQIPTTLLAMCDSAIGGKTGYNTKYGKNLVGSFYFAKKVLIDTDFLKTLKENQYKCGLGEIVKYALIEKSCKHPVSYDLLDILYEKSTYDIKQEIDKIVSICANLKAKVVELDKKEGGLRKVLNFGHTFAHAFETLSNYKGICHGEAVAYGMKCALKLARQKEFIDEEYFKKANSVIDKFKLTAKELKFKKEKVLELMKQDKKVLDNKINLILPVGSALVEIFDNIEEPSVEACLP